MFFLPAWETESGTAGPRRVPGAAEFAARLAGPPLGSFSADRLFFSTGAGLVASQYVVAIPVSWLYNNGVLWRSDM